MTCGISSGVRTFGVQTYVQTLDSLTAEPRRSGRAALSLTRSGTSRMENTGRPPNFIGRSRCDFEMLPYGVLTASNQVLTARSQRRHLSRPHLNGRKPGRYNLRLSLRPTTPSRQSQCVRPKFPAPAVPTPYLLSFLALDWRRHPTPSDPRYRPTS